MFGITINPYKDYSANSDIIKWQLLSLSLNSIFELSSEYVLPEA